MGYGGSSRSSMSGQDSHGMYSSRQGMSYGGDLLAISVIYYCLHQYFASFLTFLEVLLIRFFYWW